MNDRANSDRPLVSVVLPTYGRPELVREAVASVDEQTYPNVELLVVDDCSPTPIEPVLKALSLKASLDIRVLRHEENRGGNAARNTGIRAATGEYVSFLDDDDRWEPDKLERQVRAFRASSPEVGAICVGQRFIDEHGKTTQLRMPTTRGHVNEDVLCGATLGPFSTLMVTADLVERAGLPDERFPAWQDREWHLRLSQEGAYERISEPLTVRRISAHDQIDNDYHGQHEAAALYLEKHRSLAARYGRETERKFVANVYSSVAGTTLAAGHYKECARYSLRVLRNDPHSAKGFAYLIVGVGGPRVHELVRTTRRAYHRSCKQLSCVDEPMDEVCCIIDSQADRHRENRRRQRVEREVKRAHRPAEHCDRDDDQHEVHDLQRGPPFDDPVDHHEKARSGDQRGDEALDRGGQDDVPKLAGKLRWNRSPSP